MDSNTYSRYSMMIIMLTSAIVGSSIVVGNSVVPPFTIIAGMGAMILLKQQVDDVMVDERLYTIAQKAAWRTLQVGTVGLAILSGILTGLGKGAYPEALVPGLTLSFATCGLLLVYIVFQHHYSSKYGAACEPEEEEAVAAGTVRDA